MKPFGLRSGVAVWFVLWVLAGSAAEGAPGALKAGVGRSVITPPFDMWLAGYAGRTAPSDGAVHDLFAKALAFEDETGVRSAIITMDLLGLPGSLVRAIAERAREKFDLPRDRIMFTFSHTHSGPVIDADRLVDIYGLDAVQAARVREYTQLLPELLLKALGAALENLQPCQVDYGIGTAGFAVNRRQYTLDGVVIGVNPIGPVDHEVPALRVRRAGGETAAVLFGYACHNTTLSFQKICGDYAGFAQAYLEERIPGATALFVAGCGADANPNPRRTLEHAQAHGKALAEAVVAALSGPRREIRGPLRVAFEEIPLELSAPPSREELEKQAADANVYIARRAKRLLEKLRAEGALPTRYSYPVQVWQFADTLAMDALAGEVVVDYSLLLKHEFGRDRTWVIGYANDFCAYIPSLRVLREGGYEAADSMVYFGFHGPWAPTVERDVLGAVRALVARTKP